MWCIVWENTDDGDVDVGHCKTNEMHQCIWLLLRFELSYLRVKFSSRGLAPPKGSDRGFG